MSELVSVCVPVYNGEKYIVDTINMILNQDYDNMEILVCNNASTDNTLSELEKIKDAKVQIFSNESNLGMGGNWNRLIDLAKGKYLIIVCSDDFLLPGAISAKVAAMEANDDVCLVFSSSYVMNEEGKKILLRRPFRGNRKLLNPGVQRKLFTTKNFLAEPTNVLARTEAVRQTGYFDTDLWYTIDMDFWLRLLNLGNAYYIDTPYSGFRVYGGSATGSSLDNTKKIMADEEVFITKHKNRQLIPTDEKMFSTRKRNVTIRLWMKIVFMKLNNLKGGLKK